MAKIPKFLLDDRPASNPWASLQALAEQLADNLPRFPASAPVLISGDWGLGKTTLLEQISQKVKQDRPGSSTPVLLFEAWRHEGELPLLPALVRCLWKQALQPLQEAGDSRLQKGEEVWKSLWDAAVSFSVGAGSGLAQMALGPLGKALVDGLVQVRREETPKPNLEKTIAELTEDHGAQLWEKFAELIDLFWTQEEPLLILIDDLDRCSPAGAVQLLDSIRTILCQSHELNCRFAVALDRGVLSLAVARKFADLGHYEGNRYLEKLFPLSFDLPHPSTAELAKLINDLLQELEDKDRLGSNVEVLHRALSNPLFANPRLVKRCINRFVLLRRFETKGNEPELPPNEEELRKRIILVQWMAACERWLPLRRLLNRRNQEYWERLLPCLTDPFHKPPDAEAEELLKERDLPTWLGQHLAEGAGALYEAEKRLRKQGL